MELENDRPGILAEIVLKTTYEFLLERVHFRGEDSDFLYKF